MILSTASPERMRHLGQVIEREQASSSMQQSES